MAVQKDSEIYIYLGGTRSGKSKAAEQKVLELAKEKVLYVATAQCFGDDVGMQKRILTHKQRRPTSWELLECPVNIAENIRLWLEAKQTKSTCILIDCVTLWISNVLLTLTEHHTNISSQETLKIFENLVHKEVEALITLSHEFSAHWVLVSGETGLGGIGTTSLERMFHDGLGLANQLLVAQSREAFFVVAGRSLKL